MDEPELQGIGVGQPERKPLAEAARDADPEREPEAEPEAEPEGEHAPQAIRLGDRIVFLGNPGQGKSEGLLNLFAVYRGQRLLIDVQNHYELGPEALAEDPPPLELEGDPSAIDWRHRTIRYVPRRPGDRREMDALHHAIYQRGNLFVACDEAEDVAPSQGGGASPFTRKVLKQGRKLKITYGAASQRPFGVERSIVGQAEHALLFRMSDRDDLGALKGRLGMELHELHAALNSLGEHEYLRHDLGVTDEQGDPLVIRMPALPPDAIAYTRRHVINDYYSTR